jgi:hypothetical protein
MHSLQIRTRRVMAIVALSWAMIACGGNSAKGNTALPLDSDDADGVENHKDNCLATLNCDPVIPPAPTYCPNNPDSADALFCHFTQYINS